VFVNKIQINTCK